MNKTLKIILILVAVAAVAYFVISRFTGNEQQQQAGPPQGPMAQRVTVDVFVVSPTAYQNRITSTGTVMPNEEVMLSSEIAGRVTSLKFDEGSRVKKGQLLMTVNDEELRAQLQKLQSNQKLYRDMEERQRTLLEKEYISRQEYDQVSNQLAAVTADIKALQASINKAYVRAPFDGVIGLRQVSEGSFVAANTPVARLVDTSPVKIDFSVPGRYSSMVKENDMVSFTVEGNPQVYQARIYAVDPSIDPATRTMRVRAMYANSKEEVMPGAFVRINITLKEMEEAILLPTESIVPEIDGHKVFLVKSGKAVPQMVSIGQRSDRLIQIIEGIEPGDTVVQSGILQVRPGSNLRIRRVLTGTAEQPATTVADTKAAQ
jgi:membrane fusion protein, multidrug efflux system